MLVELVGAGIESTLDEDDNVDEKDSTRRAILIAYGLGTRVGYLLPFGRLQENEADRIGLMYAARAGYDPRAAIELWQKMYEGENGSPPAFLSTHPADQTRIDKLTEHMPEAMLQYESAQAR